jgi:two-component sensor histidine kinase
MVLSERIQALGRAHAQLFDTDWKGAALKDIIAAELAPFADRVDTEGPPVTIDGKRVQTLHLVLHELTTNAIKYGSLSNQDGRVLIVWSIAGSGADARLKFRWEERGGPVVNHSLTSRQGFGRTLLGAAFINIGVEPQFVYAPSGFIYELDAPLNSIARGP